MNTQSKTTISSPAAGTQVSRLFTRIARYVRQLFEPEVVEVTFHVEGRHVTYTYTKVEDKQVA